MALSQLHGCLLLFTKKTPKTAGLLDLRDNSPPPFCSSQNATVRLNCDHITALRCAIATTYSSRLLSCEEDRPDISEGAINKYMARLEVNVEAQATV